MLKNSIQTKITLKEKDTKRLKNTIQVKITNNKKDSNDEFLISAKSTRTVTNDVPNMTI